MAAELSSNCECSICLEGVHSESDWESSSEKRGDGTTFSRSSKKSTLSPIMRRFLSQCCSNRPENDKEDPVFLSSEGESSVGFSQGQNVSETPKNSRRKSKARRELTIQELLRKFGDTGKFQPYSRSVGHFRDHVVVKFRRALYYSGMWVKHVQGSTEEKHFSARYFKRNPSSLHRLIPWLKRELTAVCGDNGYTVKNILTSILHHMTVFNLDSESFIQLLEPYLLQHTLHFLHEFTSFVHSSYNMQTYDRSAIYQCPVSTWMTNNTVSAPVLSLPKDLPFGMSQRGTKKSQNTRVQQSKTELRPHSGLKQTSNGHYSSQNPQTLTTHQKIANKFHVQIKEKHGLDDFKDMVCTGKLLLDWDNIRESGPDTKCYKNDNQEKKTEGTKQFPGLQKSRANSLTQRASGDSYQVPSRKYSLKETCALSPGQQVHYQKKETEKKLEDSSSKAFQRLPRERVLINSKSREADQSSHCVSRNVTFPTTNDKILDSFRIKKSKCSQSCQCVDAGSQRQSSFRIPRSESWCVGLRKRSLSRDQHNLSMRGRHRRKCFSHDIHRRSSKGSVHSCESACRVTSLTSVHHGKVWFTTKRSQSCISPGSCDVHTGRKCDSLTSLQTEKYQSLRKQKKKGKNQVGRPRRMRTHGLPKPQCHCVGTQTPAEFCVELGDFNDQSPMSGHSECVTSCRK